MHLPNVFSRRWKRHFLLPAMSLLCGTAYAQQPAPKAEALPSNPAQNAPITQPVQKVYAYVEQMPALPGGGGSQAIVEAIQQRIVYPKVDAASRVEGRVFVSFTVGSTGQVQEVKVVKGLSPAYDNAVVSAVQQLPVFTPGRQNGKPVAVSFTVPVTFNMAKAAEKR